jgi:hypothetical protein
MLKSAFKSDLTDFFSENNVNLKGILRTDLVRKTIFLPFKQVKCCFKVLSFFENSKSK